MTVADEHAAVRRARAQIARRRGALTGSLLIMLGAWGALIPFIGPVFHYAYIPDHAWRWTASRGWLEVLPGAAAAFGGFLVLISSRRSVALLGALLAAAAGAWFTVGTSLVPLTHTGPVGAPASSHATLRVLEELGFFSGLGVVIVFIAATAAGRLSVRSLADIHVAQRSLEDERHAQARPLAAPVGDAARSTDEPTLRTHPDPLDGAEETPAPAGRPAGQAVADSDRGRGVSVTAGYPAEPGFVGGGATAASDTSDINSDINPDQAQAESRSRNLFPAAAVDRDR